MFGGGISDTWMRPVRLLIRDSVPSKSPHLEWRKSARTHEHTSPQSSRWPLSAAQIKAASTSSSDGYRKKGEVEKEKYLTRLDFLSARRCFAAGVCDVRAGGEHALKSEVAGATVAVTSGVW